jgi:hypothetical protein
VGVFEVVDERSAVLDETSVATHPNLQDADFAKVVCGPEQEAHSVVVAKEREQSAGACCVAVGLVRKEADGVAVVSDRVIGEQDEFAVIGVDLRFNDLQGVRGRRCRSERFLGHPVAAILARGRVS